MTKRSETQLPSRRYLNSRYLNRGIAAGALASLGLLPNGAKAETVLNVAEALEPVSEPPVQPTFDDEVATDPAVEVRSRQVAWDVPWIDPGSSAEPAVPVVDSTVESTAYSASDSLLAAGIAEDVAQNVPALADYPLIEVTQEPVEVIEYEAPAAELESEEAIVIDAASNELVALNPAEIVEVSDPQTLLQQAGTPLIALAEEAEAEDDESDLETVVPLLALSTLVPDSSDKPGNNTNPLLSLGPNAESFESVSPQMIVGEPETTTSGLSEIKPPWLVGYNHVDIAPELSPSTQLALLDDTAVDESAAAQSIETTENVQTSDTASSTSRIPSVLIASASHTGDEDAVDVAENLLAYLGGRDENEEKPPWLARGSQAESAEVPNLNQAPQLALNVPRRDADKPPTGWISLTPLELLAPEGEDEIALNPDIPREVTAYDVSNLAQVSITPEDLAQAGETAVSVGASQVEFLSPESGAFLDIPATPVVLRFPIGANIALLTNGQVVDSSLVGRTETNSETQLRTQTWYGVPLASGQNTLEVISTDTGEVLQSLLLSVRGQPDRLVLLTPRSIPSDGRSTAVIHGQLLDEGGNISRWDSVVTLESSDGRFLGADFDPDMPGYQVEIERGEFRADLQSSLESHLVQLRARANGFEAFSQLQFQTPQRPNLISGTVDLRLGARGTDFYDSYREFLPVDGENGYELDLDAAVFATGNIGEWLYTGAYNSDRTLNEDCRGETTLFRASSSDCTAIYPTYGDDSYVDVTAPSTDSIYLRFERNSPSNSLATDYVMWGDYNTTELATPAQLFTATNRQLHGFKTHYNFGNLSATALYANNVEGFQRDAIAPDGTSGFYFTSERNLVPGSESVFIETEELERPGTVLERRALARGTDYEVDYDRGTLLFSDPVARTTVDGTGRLLVRRIITTYQYEDGSDTDIWAGRLQYNLSQQQGQESWLGVSYFNENQGNRDFTLYGADARIALGEQATLTAEIAQSDSSFELSPDADGMAYRVELEGNLGAFGGRAYYRSTDAGFSNVATSSFVPGQTRYGAQLTGRLGSTTSIRAQFDHEDNEGVAPQVVTTLSELIAPVASPTVVLLDNSLTTYSLGISQRFGRVNAEVDWIHRDRTDRLTPESNISSDQLRSRVTAPLGNRLTFVAQNDLNLSSNVDPIYPSRTLIGLNWEAMPWLNVGVNQIFYGGGGNDRGSATSVDVTGEHTFDSDTTIRGRFSTIDGRQLGGTIGVEQGIRLAPGLQLDLGYERVFSTFGNETAAGTQFSQPYSTRASALGLSGGDSYSVGLSYTDSADFQASSRFQHRSSSQGSNTVFDLSAVGRVSPSLTILGDYQYARTANQNLSGLGSTSTLKLGLAYRNPEDDRLNGLLRYEYRQNPNSIPSSANFGSTTQTSEHILSAEAIYAPNWRWELYGKYALRHSHTSIDGVGDSQFSSGSTVQLAQARATYRLNYYWDVVGEARWLGGDGYSETGFSIEAGYYPLPDLRLSAGYSGGATDFDFGDNRSAGGFYIGATAKLSGLLNGFGSQLPDPVQQQESVLSVVEVDSTSQSQMPSEVDPSNNEALLPTEEALPALIGADEIVEF